MSKKKALWKEQEPEKRLAKYKQLILRGLDKYPDDKQKFATQLSQYILAEVRNERRAITELAEKIEGIYTEFKTGKNDS